MTDPPYELGFMGKGWDGTGIANNPALWAEVLRVLKPGGHVAAFSGTRTYHRMACAIEDAGFEVRDQLAWTYGQGFPKSLDVSKAIDKAAGAEREVIGVNEAFLAKKQKSSASVGEGWSRPWMDDPDAVRAKAEITAPATDAARQWQGWGTALKPAWEPICLARKPLSEKTVAANVLRWGTGAINVDGCRVEGVVNSASGALQGYGGSSTGLYEKGTGRGALREGRFPANLCHDGSDEVLAAFPVTTSGSIAAHHVRTTSKTKSVYGERAAPPEVTHGDSGSAARFFYSAKASKADRAGSRHPTVKPVKLMQWLVRLITPPVGTTLDPFAGTGTTGEAAWREGFSAVLIEREAEYQADIERRLTSLSGSELPLFSEEKELA